jgi:hypothetical protein
MQTAVPTPSREFITLRSESLWSSSADQATEVLRRRPRLAGVGETGAGGTLRGRPGRFSETMHTCAISAGATWIKSASASRRRGGILERCAFQWATAVSETPRCPATSRAVCPERRIRIKRLSPGCKIADGSVDSGTFVVLLALIVQDKGGGCQAEQGKIARITQVLDSRGLSNYNLGGKSRLSWGRGGKKNPPPKKNTASTPTFGCAIYFGRWIAATSRVLANRTRRELFQKLSSPRRVAFCLFHNYRGKASQCQAWRQHDLIVLSLAGSRQTMRACPQHPARCQKHALTSNHTARKPVEVAPAKPSSHAPLR